MYAEEEVGEEDVKSIAPSKATYAQVRKLEKALGFHPTSKAGNLPDPPNDVTFVGFPAPSEGSEADKVATCIENLKTELPKFIPNFTELFQIVNVHADKTLMHLEVPGFRVTGTIDAVITSIEVPCYDLEAVASAALVLFEFMPSTDTKRVQQMKVEMWAAHATSATSRPILGVLTDLLANSNSLSFEVEVIAAPADVCNDKQFRFVITKLTLNQLGLKLREFVRPEYSDIDFVPTEQQETATEKGSRMFKSEKLDRLQDGIDADIVAQYQDLISDDCLEPRFKRQATADLFRAAGCESDLLNLIVKGDRHQSSSLSDR